MWKPFYIIVLLQNTGIYGIYNLKALAVAPEQSKGATKGLRVINFIVPSVLKSNYLDHRGVLIKPGASRPQAGTRLVSRNHFQCANVCVRVRVCVCVCVCMPPRP